MTTRHTLLLVLALAWQSQGQMFTKAVPLADGLPFEWPIKGGTDTDDRVSLAQVTKLMQTLYPESDPPGIDEVAGFRFVQVSDSVVVLMASVDFTGHGHLGTVEVVYCMDRT